MWCCNAHEDKSLELTGEKTEAAPGLEAAPELEEQKAVSLPDATAAVQPNESAQPEEAQNADKSSDAVKQSAAAGYTGDSVQPEAGPPEPAATEAPLQHDVWMAQMNQLFRRVRREPKPPGSIQCASYFRAIERMTGIYDALFSVQMVRSQLKSDLENNLGEIKERLAAANMDAETTTLRELMLHDLNKVGIDKVRLHRERSAIWGQLWVNRASKFIFTFLREILEGKTGTKAAETAYATLQPFHGWFTRKFVGMAMTAASVSREGLLAKLEFPDEATAMKETKIFLELGEPIVADILELMEEMGTNFPDRM